MPTCLLPGCNTGASRQRQTVYKNVRQHLLPKDPADRKKWLKVIKEVRADLGKPARPISDKDFVCGLHFQEEDYLPDHMNKTNRNTKKVKKKLKPGAYPKLFLRKPPPRPPRLPPSPKAKQDNSSLIRISKEYHTKTRDDHIYASVPSKEEPSKALKTVITADVDVSQLDAPENVTVNVGDTFVDTVVISDDNESDEPPNKKSKLTDSSNSQSWPLPLDENCTGELNTGSSQEREVEKLNSEIETGGTSKYASTSLRNEHGCYPPWMSPRKIKRLKKKKKGTNKPKKALNFTAIQSELELDHGK